jgi:hypothetical protein
MLQPKKPVVKKTTTKKTKSVSERLGDSTFRDVKNAGEDMLQIVTLGGYGKIKKALGSEYKYKKIGEKKYGGKVTKAKNGTSLGMKSVKAGFDKNPGVTRADIITAATKKAQNGKILPIKKSKVKGNPAFELEYQKFKNQQEMRRMKLEKEQKAKEASYPKSNKAKKGATVKKAAMGIKVVPKNLNKRQLERVQRINETNPERSRRVANRISDRRNARGAENLRMNGDAQFNMKSGGSMKKCKYGCK